MRPCGKWTGNTGQLPSLLVTDGQSKETRALASHVREGQQCRRGEPQPPRIRMRGVEDAVDLGFSGVEVGVAVANGADEG